MSLDALTTVSKGANNSSQFANLPRSISHARTNVIVLDNISNQYLIDGEIQIPIIDFLKKYETYIRQYSSVYSLKKQLFYRPEYVSYELYGTTDLWYLVLFMNNMTRPMELSGETINVFNPIYVDHLIRLMNDYKADGYLTEPTKVTRTAVKSLTKKSDSLFSEKHDDFIEPIIATKENKQNTIINFFDSFKNTSTIFAHGKLTKKLYRVLDEIGHSKELVKTELISGIFLDHNVKSGGLPATWNNKFVMDFDGLYYAKETGKYKFRPLFTGDAKIWFEGKEIYSHTSESFQASRNLFEDQTGNSDFKLGNSDGWNITDGALVDDVDLNKKVLRKYYNGNSQGSSLATLDIDISSIPTGEELAFTTKYKSISNRHMRFAGSRVRVRYTNGYTDIFENNNDYDYFSNIGNYVDNTVIVTFQPSMTLQSIQVTFPVEKAEFDNEEINGEVSISEFRVQRMFLWKTFEVDLEAGKWYDFKIEYKLITHPAPYFQMYTKAPSDTIFKIIPSDLLGTYLETVTKNTRQNYTTRVSLFNLNKTQKYKTLYVDKIGLNGMPVKEFSPEENLCVTQEFDLFLNPNTVYRLTADPQSVVNVYRNGKLWMTKEIGDAYVEQEIVSGDTINYSNILIEYLQQNTKSISFSLQNNPDDNDNYRWNDILTPPSIVIGDYLEPWTTFGNNNIFFKNETDGIETFVHNSTVELKDYTFKVLINSNDFTKRGNIGIIFRHSHAGYYLLTLRREEDNPYIKKTIASGLYKVTNDYDYQNIMSDASYKKRAKRLQLANFEFKSTESMYLTIMAYNNRISIFLQGLDRDLISYDDIDTDRLLEGNIGFEIVNMKDVAFGSMELVYQ